jgi:hypothetical protein
VIHVEHGRYLAAHIPKARLVELPGDDHLVWVGDADAVLAEGEEFLTGARPAAEPDRVLATVLFTDLVRSTAKLAALGRELLSHRGLTCFRDLRRPVRAAVLDGELSPATAPKASRPC